MTSVEAIRRVLADAPEDGVCDACLARVCGASLSEIRQITKKLLEEERCGHGAVCARCGRDEAINLLRCVRCQQPIGLEELTSRLKDGLVHTSCLVLGADSTIAASHDGPRRAHKLAGRNLARRTVARSLVAVVDDDLSVRRALSRLLAASGYRVSAFGSGRELLDWLPGETPSCLVLDVRMPGLSGIAVHEAIRAAGNRVPVVFITGDVEIPATTRATSGSIAILSKPVDDDELFATVHRLIASGEDALNASSAP